MCFHQYRHMLLYAVLFIVYTNGQYDILIDDGAYYDRQECMQDVVESAKNEKCRLESTIHTLFFLDLMLGC